MSEAYQPHRILLTGGLGFIGSHLVNYLVEKYPDVLIVNLDRHDYCSSLKNITVADAPNYRYVKGDMGTMDFVMHILQSYNIDTIMNLAAQSSVDHSENNSIAHVQDNIVAVHTMLEATRRYGKIRRFLQVSTDETLGDQVDGIAATEDSILAPNNIYASTKACGELLCRAYRVSYKLPLILSKGNNVHGFGQHTDKVFPRFCTQLLSGKKVTVHGDGLTSRSFLHVSDTVKALETILLKGVIGETYNIGTRRELTVLEVADTLRRRICPDKTLADIVEYVKDRPYNDKHYKITSDKLRALGWKEEKDFDQGIDELVEWYRNHGDDHWE